MPFDYEVYKNTPVDLDWHQDTAKYQAILFVGKDENVEGGQLAFRSPQEKGSRICENPCIEFDLMPGQLVFFDSVNSEHAVKNLKLKTKPGRNKRQIIAFFFSE